MAKSAFLCSRGDWIRTSDPLLPKQVRYQAALRPDWRRSDPQAALISPEPPDCQYTPAIAQDFSSRDRKNVCFLEVYTLSSDRECWKKV